MKSVILSNGIIMPPIIISTNHMDYSKMKEVVMAGLKIGFRAFDTARDYFNEPVVGQVLKECLSELGLKREDIFITTKIGNSQQEEGNICEQINISLHNLQTDYIDCWMMHWPYSSPFTINPSPTYIDTYHQMEKVYQTGKARAIGMANFRIRHFKRLWDEGIEITPHCVQFEHHPLLTADDLFEFCTTNNIAVQAYSPLCRMIPAIKNSLILNTIANRIHKTIGQVILRWHYQHQSVPCFLSTNTKRLEENFNIWDFELTEEDMKQIHTLNKDYKYHLESASCPGY